jgi:GMP synthase (glutamine-hydrolysing)
LAGVASQSATIRLKPRALAIVHQRDAGPGVFAGAIGSSGFELETWLPAEAGEPVPEVGEYDVVLIFGGAMHADQEDRYPWLAQVKATLRTALANDVPLLGVCLGAQLIAEAAGSPARRAGSPEIGWYGVEVTAEGASDPVVGPLAPRFEAFQWHSYEFPLPEGAALLAHSPVCSQAYRLGRSTWGIQFHAEVTLDDASAWIDDYRSDEDAVKLDLNVDDLRRQTRAAINDWNTLGRGLCERFLSEATTRA